MLRGCRNLCQFKRSGHVEDPIEFKVDNLTQDLVPHKAGRALAVGNLLQVSEVTPQTRQPLTR
jgi:hypothetical protein